MTHANAPLSPTGRLRLARCVRRESRALLDLFFSSSEKGNSAARRLVGRVWLLSSR